MRAGVYNTVPRVIVRHIAAVLRPVKRKLEHLHAGDTGVRKQFFGILRNSSKVLGDKGDFSELFFHFFEKRHARAFSVFTAVLCRFRAIRERVKTRKAEKMVDPDHIIQRQSSLQTGNPESIVRFLLRVPVIDRIPPQLPGL